MAIRHAKQGKSQPPFVTALIPDEEHAWVYSRIRDKVLTPADIRAVFDAARSEFPPIPHSLPTTDEEAVAALADALKRRIDTLTVTELRALRARVDDALGS